MLRRYAPGSKKSAPVQGSGFLSTTSALKHQTTIFYSSGSLLRLRKDNKNTLTFKTRPVIDDPEFKILKEFEVDVSNFETMQTILGALGFRPSFVYEKYRKTFSLGPAAICVDRMPFGDFLEIEGNRDDIRTIAHRLDLDWPERIVLNYRTMFDIIKKELNLTFSDITFENFKGVKMDIRRFIPRFFPDGE